MCLTVLAWKLHPRWRVVLAGNRDEFHARPTLPLSRWRPDPRQGEILAGRDLRSGGTWLGLDARGRCSVVTNFRAPGVELPGGTSRGSLPVDFLDSANCAHDHAETVRAQASRYAPFNLLLVDSDQCSYVGNQPEPLVANLQPGVHGMSNGVLALPWPKTRRLTTALQSWLQGGSDDPAPLWRALADETAPIDSELPDTGVGIELERLLAPAFIRGPTYGTRASTLVAIDHEGRGWISERRFGPDGVFEGETTLDVQA